MLITLESFCGAERQEAWGLNLANLFSIDELNLQEKIKSFARIDDA